MVKRSISGPRPPAYVSKATLAAELDICESTVDVYVRRGLLPKPIQRGSLIRWCWAAVDEDLRKQAASNDAGDPFMLGLDNA